MIQSDAAAVEGRRHLVPIPGAPRAPRTLTADGTEPRYRCHCPSINRSVGEVGRAL